MQRWLTVALVFGLLGSSVFVMPTARPQVATNVIFDFDIEYLNLGGTNSTLLDLRSRDVTSAVAPRPDDTTHPGREALIGLNQDPWTQTTGQTPDNSWLGGDAHTDHLHVRYNITRGSPSVTRSCEVIMTLTGTGDREGRIEDQTAAHTNCDDASRGFFARNASETDGVLDPASGIKDKSRRTGLTNSQVNAWFIGRINATTSHVNDLGMWQVSAMWDFQQTDQQTAQGTLYVVKPIFRVEEVKTFILRSGDDPAAFPDQNNAQPYDLTGDRYVRIRINDTTPRLPIALKHSVPFDVDYDRGFQVPPGTHTSAGRWLCEAGTGTNSDTFDSTGKPDNTTDRFARNWSAAFRQARVGDSTSTTVGSTYEWTYKDERRFSSSAATGKDGCDDFQSPSPTHKTTEQYGTQVSGKTPKIALPWIDTNYARLDLTTDLSTDPDLRRDVFLWVKLARKTCETLSLSGQTIRMCLLGGQAPPFHVHLYGSCESCDPTKSTTGGAVPTSVVLYTPVNPTTPSKSPDFGQQKSMRLPRTPFLHDDAITNVTRRYEVNHDHATPVQQVAPSATTQTVTFTQVGLKNVGSTVVLMAPRVKECRINGALQADCGPIATLDQTGARTLRPDSMLASPTSERPKVDLRVTVAPDRAHGDRIEILVGWATSPPPVCDTTGDNQMETNCAGVAVVERDTTFTVNVRSGTVTAPIVSLVGLTVPLALPRATEGVVPPLTGTAPLYGCGNPGGTAANRECGFIILKVDALQATFGGTVRVDQLVLTDTTRFAVPSAAVIQDAFGTLVKGEPIRYVAVPVSYIGTIEQAIAPGGVLRSTDVRVRLEMTDPDGNEVVLLDQNPTLALVESHTMVSLALTAPTSHRQGTTPPRLIVEPTIGDAYNTGERRLTVDAVQARCDTATTDPAWTTFFRSGTRFELDLDQIAGCTGADPAGAKDFEVRSNLEWTFSGAQMQFLPPGSTTLTSLDLQHRADQDSRGQIRRTLFLNAAFVPAVTGAPANLAVQGAAPLLYARQRLTNPLADYDDAPDTTATPQDVAHARLNVAVSGDALRVCGTDLPKPRAITPTTAPTGDLITLVRSGAGADSTSQDTRDNFGPLTTLVFRVTDAQGFGLGSLSPTVRVTKQIAPREHIASVGSVANLGNGYYATWVVAPPAMTSPNSDNWQVLFNAGGDRVATYEIDFPATATDAAYRELAAANTYLLQAWPATTGQGPADLLFAVLRQEITTTQVRWLPESSALLSLRGFITGTSSSLFPDLTLSPISGTPLFRAQSPALKTFGAAALSVNLEASVSIGAVERHTFPLTITRDRLSHVAGLVGPVCFQTPDFDPVDSLGRWALDTRAFPDLLWLLQRPHTLHWAMEKGGNFATAVTELTAGQAPSLTVVLPEPGAEVQLGTNITLRVQAEGAPSSVTAQILRQGSATPQQVALTQGATGVWSASWQPAQTGNYTITFSSVPTPAVEPVVNVRVVPDAAPQITIEPAGFDGGFVRPGTHNVAIRATDPHLDATNNANLVVNVTRNGAGVTVPAATCVAGSRCQTNVSLTLADGDRVGIRVNAKDDNNNARTRNVNATADGSGPVTTLAVDPSGLNDRISPNTTVSGNATDAGSGLSSVSLTARKGGADVGNATGTTTASLALQGRGLGDGDIVAVTFQATDRAGNTATARRNLTVDTRGPIISTADVARTTAGVQFRIPVDDMAGIPDNGVTLHHRIPPATTFTPVTGARSGDEFTVLLNVTESGVALDYFIVARDRLGNQAQQGSASAPLQFLIGEPENRPPTVRITSPTQGQNVTGSLEVEFTTTDPDGDLVSVESIAVTAGGETRNAASLVSGALVDLSGLPPGAATVRVVAEDTEGAQGSASVSFVIGTGPGPGEGPVSIVQPPSQPRAGEEIRLTVEADAPDEATQIRFELRDANGTVVDQDTKPVSTTGTYNVVFETSDPGRYTLAATFLDSDGEPVGDTVEGGTFTVLPGVELERPTVLFAVVAALAAVVLGLAAWAAFGRWK